jgi:hypothetical protein|tara:strand:+ start:1176 stop:1430 length:255 start_codon:yes stop_codon:yes gene_type:complete
MTIDSEVARREFALIAHWATSALVELGNHQQSPAENIINDSLEGCRRSLERLESRINVKAGTSNPPGEGLYEAHRLGAGGEDLV